MNESDLELYSIVGKMFRELREKKGYTLEDGAAYLDIAPKSLQRYECGERKIKVGIIKSLCNFYGINCSDFMKEAKIRFVSDLKASNDFSLELKKEEKDLRLQKIINCYNEMDETGRGGLLDQAEYILNKHPKTKTNQRVI